MKNEKIREEKTITESTDYEGGRETRTEREVTRTSEPATEKKVTVREERIDEHYSSEDDLADDDLI